MVSTCSPGSLGICHELSGHELTAHSSANRRYTPNICRASEACEHVVGTIYSVRAGRTVTEGTLHEISLVKRPRDPLTRITNKHLLPVYDRPMVFYPIQTLVDAGIKDIIIVTSDFDTNTGTPY